MTRPPQAVWIVDTKKEHLGGRRGAQAADPVIGILDTNCDPDEVDFAIPGNDDAIRSVSLAHSSDRRRSRRWLDGTLGCADRN
jgi:small subunit ribosomal protein S2